MPYSCGIEQFRPARRELEEHGVGCDSPQNTIFPRLPDELKERNPHLPKKRVVSGDARCKENLQGEAKDRKAL